MNTYRLTNTTCTEVAARLPLVTLPVSFGSISPELSLFDDNEVSSMLVGKSEAVINAQAGKIAELLKATDINYLSLQEEAKNGVQMSAERGSLMAAVLLHDSDAFTYTLLGPPKRGAWRISTLERRQSQAGAMDNWGPKSLQVAHQFSEGPSISNMNSPSPARATMVKRKEAPEVKIERHQCKKPATGLMNPEKSNQESLVNEVRELLDEIFARTEVFGDDEGVDGTSLSLAEIRSIGEVVVKLRSKNIIQNLPVDYHLRLLSLLDQHVQRANGREVNEDDDGESMNFEFVMSGLEAVQISLTIMTGSSMAKQIYKEEIIDRIIDFARFQIVHSVFTAYDSGYRQIHKGSEVGGDEGDDAEYFQALENGSSSARKSRKKSKASARIRKIARSKYGLPLCDLFLLCCKFLRIAFFGVGV